MDISETLAPKSEQLDAVDLVAGARTFTVTRVDVTQSPDQPVSVHFAEFPRPWRPGVNMRRVLAGAWGRESDGWIGHRVTLFCDPRVQYGGEEVGGVRVSHMSHIGEKPRQFPVIPRKGRGGMYSVQPLVEKPETADPNAELIAALTTEWRAADVVRRKAIEAEVAALRAGDAS